MNTDALLLARVAGSLAVVVMLALVAARLARRTGRGRGSSGLQVRERVGLTRETSAVVLEAGGRRLLVGVSPHQVTLLAELGWADAVRSAPEEAAETAAAPGVRVHQVPMSRKVVRELDRTRRKALPPKQRGRGSVLDPRTWQQGIETLRDLTARRG